MKKKIIFFIAFVFFFGKMQGQIGISSLSLSLSLDDLVFFTLEKPNIDSIMRRPITITKKIQDFTLKKSSEMNTNRWMSRKIGGITCNFLAGIFYGYHEVQEHYYYMMEKVHGDNLNAKFWGPKQWENKWAKDKDGKMIYGKEAFWGSSKLFVVFMDADHSTIALDRSLTTISTVLNWIGMPKQKFVTYVIEFVVNFGARSLGFWYIHDYKYSPYR